MKKTLSVLCVLAMLITMLAACDTHEHTFATDKWEKDADFHWHPCTAVEGCTAQGEKAAHDFEVVVNAEGKPTNQCKTCGATNDKVSTAPEHEHTFADKFESSENFHWYPCTVEGCYEMKDKAEHAFGNPEITYADQKMTVKYVCVNCEYEKVTEQTVTTKIDSATSWDDAFKEFKLTNFTMDVYFKYEDEEQTNHCVVTDKSVYYCIPDSNEFYSVLNEDGSCTTYSRYDADAPFTLLNDTSDRFLTGAQTETVLQVSFEENFDKFTYDEASASYVCEDVIKADCLDWNGDVIGTLSCFNNVVKFVDGKISYISADYYFDDQELMSLSQSFKYYNIGYSAVEIPQSVIDGAVEDTEEDNEENEQITVEVQTQEQFESAAVDVGGNDFEIQTGGEYYETAIYDPDADKEAEVTE